MNQLHYMVAYLSASSLYFSEDIDAARIATREEFAEHWRTILMGEEESLDVEWHNVKVPAQLGEHDAPDGPLKRKVEIHAAALFHLTRNDAKVNFDGYHQNEDAPLNDDVIILQSLDHL